MVHEEDARAAHLVLPASAELTDAQLEQAAGGGICESGRTDRLESLPKASTRDHPPLQKVYETCSCRIEVETEIEKQLS